MKRIKQTGIGKPPENESCSMECGPACAVLWIGPHAFRVLLCRACLMRAIGINGANIGMAEVQVNQ